MITKILQAVISDLNASYMRRFQASGKLVELSALVAPDGSAAVQGENKIICSLIHIQQERVNINTPPGRQALRNPPLQLQLYVLFSAYYTPNNYAEGLTALSSVLDFFHGKQVFTRQNSVQMPTAVDKVTVELTNMDIQELSQFWSSVSTKHLPALLYKFRFVSASEEMVLQEIPSVISVENP